MQEQQHLAHQWASLIDHAERPAPFSSRDGGVLRLVPPNERMCLAQTVNHLLQVLSEPHMQEEFEAQLPNACRHKVPPRHLAAWARGCCYIQAGNSRQALKDARTSMAYAASKSAMSMPSVEEHQPTATTIGSDTTGSQCRWFPALLLAGQCYAALEEPSQAVLHLAQAQQVAPCHATAAVAALLSQAVRCLPPELGFAWASGGLPGLQQQLQVEAEMRLPEVLRPRPKWYYYNQWMRQRIHLALLELQISCRGNTAGGQLLLTDTDISTTSSRGRLLLGLLAAGTAESPAVAAAAEAAGFQVAQTGHPSTPALTATAADAAVAAEENGGVQHLMKVEQQSHKGCASGMPLQLPEEVTSKLLSVDAGELDLMVQHPIALQGQVYELLDILQASGPEALSSHTVKPLTWEEMQVLAGRDTVGLPLGYKPGPAALPPTAAAGALTAAAAAGSSKQLALEGGHIGGGTGAVQAGPVGLDILIEKSASGALQVGDNGVGSASVPAGEQGQIVPADGDRSKHMPGWRQVGWTRCQYVMAAVAAADGSAQRQQRLSD